MVIRVLSGLVDILGLSRNCELESESQSVEVAVAVGDQISGKVLTNDDEKEGLTFLKRELEIVQRSITKQIEFVDQRLSEIERKKSETNKYVEKNLKKNLLDVTRTSIVSNPNYCTTPVPLIDDENWDTDTDTCVPYKNDPDPTDTFDKCEEPQLSEIIDQNSTFNFSNLQGFQDQIKYLQGNVVIPWVNRDILVHYGVESPKGLIFYGPTSCGQVVLAKALTAELSRGSNQPFNFFQRHCSDYFKKYSDEPLEPYNFIKRIFEVATERKPSVILLSGFDSLSMYTKSSGAEGTALKTIIEKFDRLIVGDVLVIVAINDLRDFPPPLLIEGRFNKSLPFDVLNTVQRRGILEFHCASSLRVKQKPSSQILDEISQKSKGFLDYELEKICRDSYTSALIRRVELNVHSTNDKLNPVESTIVLPADWNSALKKVKEDKLAQRFPENWDSQDESKNNSFISEEIFEDSNFSFETLEGMDEEIKFLRDNVIIPMANQEILFKNDLEPLKGIIFHGPGSRKLLLVKTLVAELSRYSAQPFSFFQRRAFDVFSEHSNDMDKFLKDIFTAAIGMKPGVIFLDEIETICLYSSTAGSRGNNGAKILIELMSKIKAGVIIVIAGTNELSKVDPHLMGRGKFDKFIKIDYPNEEQALQILKSHSSKWNQTHSASSSSAPDEVPTEILKKVKDFSEDDLERICQDTFMSSLRREIKSEDKYKLNDKVVPVRITPEDWTSGLASVEKYKSSIKLNGIFLEETENKSIRPEVIDKNLRFSSIVGLDEEIKIFCESVQFPMGTQKLLEPTSIKGIIFYGNDSSGQILLAKTLAAELSRSRAQEVHFFQRQKSDIFSSLSYSQEKEKFLRRIFTTAIDMKPAIIYLDDFDTLCSPDVENSVKALSEQMDLITPGEVIVIVGMKNLFKGIPPPLLRRGYLEKSIIFNPPCDERRAAILKSLISDTCDGGDGNEYKYVEIIREITKSTVGFLEEDLEQVFRESNLLAIQRRSGGTQVNELNPNQLTIDLCDWKKGRAIVEKDINSKKLMAEICAKDEETQFQICSERIQSDSNSGLDSIRGMEKQIKFVQENIIFPMVNQESLENHDLEPIKGIVFYGPSGLGQLTLAKALTAELSQKLAKSFTFFHRRMSDVFEHYSHDAGKYLKRLFALAIIQKPSVIFIEDFATLCTVSEYSGPDKNVKILFDQMDMFKPGEVIVIASALTLDEIYTPLLRIGYFEKSVDFSDLSDQRRLQIIQQSNSSKWNEDTLGDSMDDLVKKTKDFTEHDMERLCRRTRMLALQRKMAKENNDKVKANSTEIKGEGIDISPDDWTASLDDIGKDKASTDQIKSCKDDKEENTIHSEIIEASLGFCSLGGLEDQMKVIRDSVMFPIINKSALMDWGVEPIKGVIFHGPPGTGKTLLAKALASELSRLGEEPFTFFYQKGTQALQKYVGWTESYLRKLFAKAVTKKPAIIFFDEIDGLFAARGDGSDSNTNYQNGIVSTLLGLLDTVKRGEILVIAATNRFHSLDPAMIRPGRFDKQIAFFPPKEEGRKRILEIHTSKWKDGQWKNSLAEIAKQTEGYTGADLEQLCRETFHSALGRQFPNLDAGTGTTKIPAGGFEHFDITSLDWYTALSKVKMSCSGVFGNAITSGKAIPPDIAKLISGIELEIMEKFKVFLKVSTRVIVPGDGNEKGAGIKSILVWSKGIQQNRFFENFIIPSLIGSPGLKDVNLFTLGSDKYDIPSINGIMKQILTSPKTAILFIPRIDQLVTKLVQLETHHLFMKQMDSLRGENVIVLASAGCPISDLPDDIRCVFKGMEGNKSYKIRKFENAERKEFFSSILSENYPTLLDRVEVLTVEANFYDLLDLKAELNHCCASGKENNLNAKQLGVGLNNILDIYETKKLDHTGTSNHMYS